jgi:23S rRNA-intervening sequence protein
MEPIFDHEKLDVYGLELQFVAWTTDFLIEASQSFVPHRRELLDQLERACLSVLLNTAEGNGKRKGLQRAKFFDDARGFRLGMCGLSGCLRRQANRNERSNPFW